MPETYKKYGCFQNKLSIISRTTLVATINCAIKWSYVAVSVLLGKFQK